MEENINIQKALFFSFLKKPGLRNKKRKHQHYLFGNHTNRNNRPEVFCKKVCLRPATLLKKRLAQVFSCEFWEISKNNFFHRTPLVATSVLSF